MAMFKSLQDRIGENVENEAFARANIKINKSHAARRTCIEQDNVLNKSKIMYSASCTRRNTLTQKGWHG